MLNKERLAENAEKLGIKTDSEMLDRINDFCEMVMETNKQFNLTAIKEPEEMEEKNALDCLTVLPLLPQKGRLADVGTGAGFPGVIIKLCKPDLEVSLIEATEKKLLFAKRAASELGYSVNAIHSRGEDAARGELRESFDVVTSRAVAALPTLLEYTLPLVRTGGILIAMKGKGAEEEIKASGNALKLLNGRIIETKSFSLPTAGERTLIVVEKTAPCPPKYPRSSGNIKKASL